MPNIRPLTDLRNSTSDIAALAHSDCEPVFITKNGYADLVVMSYQTYEDSLARLEVYDKLAKSQADVDAGRLKTLSDVFDKYKAKYGVSKSEEV